MGLRTFSLSACQTVACRGSGKKRGVGVGLKGGRTAASANKKLSN